MSNIYSVLRVQQAPREVPLLRVETRSAAARRASDIIKAATKALSMVVGTRGEDDSGNESLKSVPRPQGPSLQERLRDSWEGKVCCVFCCVNSPPPTVRSFFKTAYLTCQLWIRSRITNDWEP
jgi:hypothetical protein